MLSRGARLVRVSAVVLPTLVLLSSTAQAASAAVPTTSSVLSAAKTAIGKQTSVHLVVTSSSASSSIEEHLQADLGKTSGTETVSEGSGTVMIKVTAAYAYLSGNSSGLTKIFGLTSAEANKVGRNWIAIKAGTTQYQDLAGSTTVSSVTSILPAVKGTRLDASTSLTKKLYTLRWHTAASSSEPAFDNTLTLSAVGITLPVKETTTAPGGDKETAALSKWGEPVRVSAPPARSTIPLANVTG